MEQVIPKHISEDLYAALQEDITEQEIQQVIFYMKQSKAPGLTVIQQSFSNRTGGSLEMR